MLSVLPLHAARDESRVAAALRAAAAAITARHGAALRRAAVAQWEVRLRVPDKSGAWRVVVAAPTGHEAGEECVEVYREAAAPGDAALRYASVGHVGGGELRLGLGLGLGLRRSLQQGLPAGQQALPLQSVLTCCRRLLATRLNRRGRQVRPRARRAGARPLPAPGAAAAEAAGGAAPQDNLRLRFPGGV